MAYETLKFKIIGASPLLMHNGQLADPLNSFAKSIAEISAKRKKTDADHIEMGRREFYGSLYMSGGSPCIPGEMMEAVIIAGARKEKKGNQAKAGILVENNSPLLYDGPITAEDLWTDERFRLRVPVKVGTGKVMRTRPRFDNWSAEIEVKFLPTMVNAREVKSFLQAAGEQVGIGDWRPRFGRFEVA